ncbi:MAG: aldose epimerase family protein [Verrucomicrobiota bacterium]
MLKLYVKNDVVEALLQESPRVTGFRLFCVAVVCYLISGALSMAGVVVEQSVFGETLDGRQVNRYDLSNGRGLRVSVLNYGAMLISVEVPDRAGTTTNITLHLDDWAQYEAGHPLLGSVVGRFANRIDGGGFEIDGERFELESVNGRTGVHIHGGKTGFQHQFWDAEVEKGGVIFTLMSADGHEGYPGQVRVSVRYLMNGSENAFRIQYEATTTKPTHVNLTNHVYWNLGGAGSGDILDHELAVDAAGVLALDERKIPTGEYLEVKGGPWDFRESRTIGGRIRETGGGYDHCYVLSLEDDRELRVCAKLYDPKSGRMMKVWTTQPGVQLYSGNFLRVGGAGRAGELRYGKHDGVCLETQHFPNAPNEAGFPSTLLRPGERYHEEVVFSFSVVD